MNRDLKFNEIVFWELEMSENGVFVRCEGVGEEMLDDYDFEGKVIVNSLEDYYSWEVEYEEGVKLIDKIVDGEEDKLLRFGCYINLRNVERVNKIIRENWDSEMELFEKSKRKRSLNLRESFRVLEECWSWNSRESYIDRISNVIGSEFILKRLKGSRYFMEDVKVKKGNYGIDSLVKNIRNRMNFKLSGDKNIEIKVLYLGGYEGVVREFKEFKKIFECYFGNEEYKKIVEEVMKDEYRYDNKGFVKKSGWELVKELEEKDVFFEVKSCLIE